MPNEIRPCTLWGETFDACDVLKLSTSYVRANRHIVFIGGEWVSSPTETGRYVVVSTTSRRYFSPLVKTGEERQALLLEAITTIANALNAPVLAKKEVLKYLPKDAKVLASTKGKSWLECEYSGGFWMKLGIETLYLASLNDYVSLIDESCHIRADKDDPKTAEYLRQFTLDGVRIKEGG